MARPTKSTPKSQFTASEFINFPLSAEQKKEIKSWQPTFAEMDDEILKLTQAGYRITLKWDERSEAYACWINPTGEDHPNTGLTLSGRGSSPLKALKQALYIDRLFDGDWAGNYKSFKEEELDD